MRSLDENDSLNPRARLKRGGWATEGDRRPNSGFIGPKSMDANAYGGIFEAVAESQRARPSVRADDPVMLTAKVG